MNAQKKDVFKGMFLALTFAAILTYMFTPGSDGKNVISGVDNLYNSISKGSVYYIPALKKEAEKYKDKSMVFEFSITDEKRAAQFEALLKKTGAEVSLSNSMMKVSGSFYKIMLASLEDSDLMFNNLGNKIRSKYSLNEKEVLYNWWILLNTMDKELKKKKRFAEAKFLYGVRSKGVECSFNYYGVTPQNIVDKVGFVAFSLIFYVIYTLWFGYAIMHLFQGAGLSFDH